MACLVIMTWGLRKAEAGMTLDAWHGWQALDVIVDGAEEAQGALRHAGADGGMVAADCSSGQASGRRECAGVVAALTAAPGGGQASGSSEWQGLLGSLGGDGCDWRETG